MNKNKLNQFLFFLQPLLIALYPLFFLYSKAIGEAFFLNFLVLFFLILVSTVLFFSFLFFLYKSKLKASILLSNFFIGFYLLPLISLLSTNFKLFNYCFFRIRYMLPMFLLFLIYLFVKLFFVKKINEKWGKLLVLPFSLLIIFNVFSSIKTYFEIRSLVKKYEINNNLFRKKELNYLKYKNNLDYLPDIYFIILDRYSSRKVLKKYFDFDNSEFVKNLENLGFIETPDSLSNYPITVQSISSSLSMNFTCVKNKEDKFYGLAYYMLSYNNPFYFLRKFGYKFYNINSRWSLTSKLDLSNFVCHYDIPTEFTQAYWDRTFIGLFVKYFYLKRIYNFTLNQLQMLNKIYRKCSPKFVFSHIMLPHPPIIFNKKGDFVSFLHDNENKDNYLEQIIFINKKILTTIKTILNGSLNKPIIILQSDHGSYSTLLPNNIKEKFSFKDNRFLTYANLSMFYLPGINKEELPKNISPVNNFRFIFNKYFGTNFEILENKLF